MGSKYDADMAMTIAMRQVRKTGGKRNKVNMDPLFSMLSSKKNNSISEMHSFSSNNINTYFLVEVKRTYLQKL